MHPVAKSTAAVAGLGAACFGWGLVEAHRFTVRHETMPVLPRGAEEVRVLHLSDLHLLPSQTDKLRFLRSLAQFGPDLVVNTGDNIASADSIRLLQVGLRSLRHIPGVFVFGSNDYVAPRFKNPLRYLADGRSHAPAEEDLTALPTDELRRALESYGWVDINTSRHVIEVQGLTFEFRGTDDAHHDRDDYSLVAGPPSDGVDVSIGVTHAPYRRILDAMTADGCDAILAGHTHGGQVCVPGWGALVTNCDIEPARVKGVSTHQAEGRTSWLHVSAGLGTSPYAPFRFACPPEVSLLRLTARP